MALLHKQNVLITTKRQLSSMAFCIRKSPSSAILLEAKHLCGRHEGPFPPSQSFTLKCHTNDMTMTMTYNSSRPHVLYIRIGKIRTVCVYFDSSPINILILYVKQENRAT